VPVYIIGIVPSIDNPSEDAATPSADKPWQAGLLDDLKRTGGAFTVSTPVNAVSPPDDHRRATPSVLISFESSGNPGWHPLLVRTTRDKTLTVRAEPVATVNAISPAFVLGGSSCVSFW
jgi:hypothetical protein